MLPPILHGAATFLVPVVLNLSLPELSLFRVNDLCAAALYFAFLLRFASMEGEEYLGFSGRFLDPRYCHWIMNFSEDSEGSGPSSLLTFTPIHANLTGIKQLTS